jgi:hypothetical protein
MTAQRENMKKHKKNLQKAIKQISQVEEKRSRRLY